MYPIAYGPAKPDRLPMELMTAIPPAAAAPDRNAVGSVQNTGRQPNTPNAATEKAIIFAVGSASSEAARIAAPASSSANAVWNLRSPVRSERRPQYTMAKVPTA